MRGRTGGSSTLTAPTGTLFWTLVTDMRRQEPPSLRCSLYCTGSPTDLGRMVADQDPCRCHFALGSVALGLHRADGGTAGGKDNSRKSRDAHRFQGSRPGSKARIAVRYRYVARQQNRATNVRTVDHEQRGHTRQQPSDSQHVTLGREYSSIRPRISQGVLLALS